MKKALETLVEYHPEQLFEFHVPKSWTFSVHYVCCVPHAPRRSKNWEPVVGGAILHWCVCKTAFSRWHSSCRLRFSSSNRLFCVRTSFLRFCNFTMRSRLRLLHFIAAILFLSRLFLIVAGSSCFGVGLWGSGCFLFGTEKYAPFSRNLAWIFSLTFSFSLWLQFPAGWNCPICPTLLPVAMLLLTESNSPLWERTRLSKPCNNCRSGSCCWNV